MQAAQLHECRIKGLNGFRSYRVTFRDNRLILVGENGTGKTTILKLVYYFISRDWPALLSFDFERIELRFTNGHGSPQVAEFSKQEAIELATGPILDEIFLRRAMRDLKVGDAFKAIIDGYRSLTGEERGTEDMLVRRPARFMAECGNDKLFQRYYDVDDRLRDAFENRVLYLPTYRRIEEELGALIGEPGARPDPRSTRPAPPFESEMIKFGMEDVERAIIEKENEIRAFSQRAQNDLTLRYLKRILSHEYEQVDNEGLSALDESAKQKVLARIDEDLLAASEKREVFRIVADAAAPGADVSSLDTAGKIVCHYFLLLSEFDKELEKHEQCFSAFCDICNSYLVSNRIEYDEQSYTCRVVNTLEGRSGQSRRDAQAGREIALGDLSSGEKQIAALFSRLNLQGNDPLFVFIDEPELSLSIDWQRRPLVDVVDSVNCIGLFATTHSPFVFDNDLLGCVSGINEFLDWS